MTNRILSWKINNGVYAYIYLPGQNTYLGKKYSDDSSIWQDIIKEVNSEEKYKTHYNKMIAEIKNKYGIVFDSDYKRYYNFNSSFGTNNIVVLSGKDGYNALVDSDVAEDLSLIKAKLREIELLKNEINDIIEGKFDYYKEYVNTQTNSALEEVTRLISSVDDTFNNINDKIDNLEEIKNQISEDNKEILDSIDKKTSETIKEVNDSVDQIKEDVNKKVTEINELKGELDAEFAGLKGKLDGLEGSLTEVGQKIDENTGTIETFANWYDANASAATEVINYINASAAQISDVVTYVGVDESGSSLMTKVESKINGVSGTIIDSVYTEYSGVVTNITNSINSLSAIVETDLTRIDNISSSITNINTEMSALKGSVETSLTNVSGISGSVVSINETMNVISGFVETNLISVSGISGSVVSINETMDVLSGYVNTSLTSIDNISGSVTTVQQELSTTSGITNAVFNLVAKDNGDGTYDYSDNLGTFAHQSVSGFIQTAINSCITISEKVDALDGSMTEYIEKIDSATSATTMLMEHWDTICGITKTVQSVSGTNKFESYINQTSSGITEAILKNGEVVAGYFMNAISGDTEAQEYIFGITADKFVVDADMITNALCAHTANIGGISIGNQKITCNSGFTLDGVNRKLTIEKGNVGGFNIENNKLEVKDTSGVTIAYLNGSEDLILAAGISEKNMLKYDCIDSDYNDTVYVFYTEHGDAKQKINSDRNSIINATAYQYNEDTKTLKKLTNKFYYEYSNKTFNLYLKEKYYEDSILKSKTYSATTTVINIKHENTQLSSDGTFISNTIFANNGNFTGTIDADGIFKGELENVTGSLNGVSINASNITTNTLNGDIEIGSGSSIIFVNSSGNPYLTMSQDLSTEEKIIYKRITPFNRDYSDGDYLNQKVTVFSVDCFSGDVITIPMIASCIQVTNPGASNPSSYIKLDYKTNNTIIRSVSANTNDYGKIQHTSIFIEEQDITISAKCKFTISLTYDIHVPSLFLGGAGNVHIDEIDEDVKIKRNVITDGTSITSQGFSAKIGNSNYLNINKENSELKIGSQTINKDQIIFSLTYTPTSMMGVDRKYRVEMTKNGIIFGDTAIKATSGGDINYGKGIKIQENKMYICLQGGNNWQEISASTVNGKTYLTLV